MLRVDLLREKKPRWKNLSKAWGWEVSENVDDAEVLGSVDDRSSDDYGSKSWSLSGPIPPPSWFLQRFAVQETATDDRKSVITAAERVQQAPEVWKRWGFV